MTTKQDEFISRLRATFKVEAVEHLQAMTAGLLGLEKAPAPEAQREIVALIFRAAHSLKGAASAVDFTDIESSCQTLEDLFASWKGLEGTPTPEAFDTGHRVLDAIGVTLSGPKVPGGGRVSEVPAPEDRPRPVLETVTPAPSVRVALPAAPAPERVAASSPSTEPKAAVAEDTVRITVAKLDARLVEAEELLMAKLSMDQRAEELRGLGGRFDAWRQAWAAVEPQARAVRHTLDHPEPGRANGSPNPELVRLLEFFDWNREHFKLLESDVAGLTRAARQDRHAIGKLVDDLLESSKKLLLLPFATIAAPFPKLVRDLCRDLHKEAELMLRGEDVEIDKRVLEEVKDPLIHLLRNCVDHGVEMPDVRVGLGKPARATITIAVSQSNGGNVEIVVSDDGAGIALEKVKASAVKNGLLSVEGASRLDDAEACALAFEPEVSSSPIITRLSGRGLGMAIVRERAHKLGGTVSVESKPGAGTRFRIVLPSMLATFRGVLIEAAGRLFVVPTAQVERVTRVRAEEVQSVEGRETVALGGRAVALVRLAEVLGLPPAADRGDCSRPTILVLGMGDQRIAFVVDAVLHEQEVLVKPLPKPLSRIRNIAGATVLGSGRAAPILHVADLLKSARKAGGVAARSAAGTDPP